MHKDKEWLKEQTAQIVGFDLDHRFGIMSDRYIPLNKLLELIDQLDEPETFDKKEFEALNKEFQNVSHQLDELVTYIYQDMKIKPMDYKDIVSIAIDLLKKNKKEKPVVPQFVADWFEENKDNLDNTIFYYCRDLHDTVKEDLEKFDEWFMESSDSIETLIKMKNGYEVEKEKLYHVIEPNTKQFLGYDRVTKESFWLLPQNSGALATLTEQEIKAINKKYWEYAMEISYGE